MDNAHVLTYWRWKIFMARKQRRPLAETFFIEWYNRELEQNVNTNSNNINHRALN